MKEIKCRECATWNNEDLVNCSKCGTNLRIEEIEREEKEYKLFDEGPTKFELWMEGLKKSGNPFKMFLYSILRIFYFIYAAIVAFVLWSTFWFSG